MANKKLTDLDINSLHQLNMPAKLLLAALAALAILVFSYFLLFRSQLEMLNNAETKETERVEHGADEAGTVPARFSPS